MRKVVTAIFVALVAMSSCKEKEPKITKIYELSEEMKAYFVNYEVGTKWIYQDTLDAANFDTIELISKEHFDVINETTLKKGFELYYKPIKSKDFKVRVTSGINNTYYVKVDPLEAGVTALSFENHNNSWPASVYYDKIEITGSIYHEVIISPSGNLYYSHLSVSKNNGIVYFNKMIGNAIYGCYKLIKTIKP
ncbi:MAG: hypothetical protein M0R38_03390 [Bacteroidia bacterium]|nr:hypothetical protein [Bacteroidia bacterium]